MNATDVEKFYLELNTKARVLGKLLVMENDFNGNSFLFGGTAKKLVYDVLLEKFEKALLESPGSISEGLIKS